AQRLHQRLAAEHAVGDVVGEQDAELARRAGVQEAVEARRTLDACARYAEGLRDGAQRGRRQPAGLRLGLDEDLQQLQRIPAASRKDAFQFGCGHGGLLVVACGDATIMTSATVWLS